MTACTYNFILRVLSITFFPALTAANYCIANDSTETKEYIVKEEAKTDSFLGESSFFTDTTRSSLAGIDSIDRYRNDTLKKSEITVSVSAKEEVMVLSGMANDTSRISHVYSLNKRSGIIVAAGVSVVVGGGVTYFILKSRSSAGRKNEKSEIPYPPQPPGY